MRNYTLAVALLLCMAAQAQNFAIGFNGVDQYVSIPDQNSLDLSDNFTIEGWLFPTGPGSHPDDGGIVINKEFSYELARFPDGTLQYAISAAGNGSDWAWVNTGLVAPLNTWTHFAFVKSGTTVDFYLNGVMGFTAGGAPATLTANTQEMRIASRVLAVHNFDGRIEELRIWNIARTASQIKTNIYNRQVSNNAAGLVAYYKMNEGSGATTANSSTNSTGIDGTLVNGPGWIASPVEYGTRALSFDGTDDVVSIPDDASLDITTAITLEAWVYAIKNTGIQNVVSKSSIGTNNGYIFPRTDNGWTSAIVYLHIAGVWRTLAAPFPSLNTWHHLAATYDGSNIRLFINGVQAAITAQAGAIAANANALALGNQPGFSEFFGGYVDEIRIWNVARAQADIQANMNKELDPALHANLVSYYQFNQGIVGGTNTGLTSVVDQKSSNNGTLSAFALTGASSNYVAQPVALSVLPVTWLSFSGRELNETVSLSWSTSREENTLNYTIEHSPTGSVWSQLGKVAAAGNSTLVQHYSFVHQNPTTGINFYRIKQTDLDGHSVYSRIITVILHQGKRYVIVYPNPVTDGTLRLQLPEASTVFLYSNSGKLIINRKMTAGTQQLDVSRLAKGMYRLKVGKELKQVLIQ